MGSPIETMLLNALLSSNDERFSFFFNDARYGNSNAPHGVTVERDVPVGSYRVDILLSVDGDEDFRLAVECDGHDFHDRTKQQASYDRARDRELFVIGIFTIRFTGSEIHHSVERCVADISRCLALVQKIGTLAFFAWSDGYDAGIRSIVNPKPPREL